MQCKTVLKSKFPCRPQSMHGSWQKAPKRTKKKVLVPFGGGLLTLQYSGWTSCFELLLDLRAVLQQCSESLEVLNTGQHALPWHWDANWLEFLFSFWLRRVRNNVGAFATDLKVLNVLPHVTLTAFQTTASRSLAHMLKWDQTTHSD